MSTASIELPLFTLNAVLFPGTVLPLHVFEPRYRKMIKDCQRAQKPLGVVQVKPDSEFMLEETYPVGTMAEIHHLNKLDDGRYHLMAVGIKRFRIVSQHRKKAYLSGFVVPFEDMPEPQSELNTYVRQARVLFGSYLNLLLETVDKEEVATNLPETAEDLSHFIAYFLEIGSEQKQHYLELNSTLQRLQEEITILRREIPFMRQILFSKPSDKQIRLN